MVADSRSAERELMHAGLDAMPLKHAPLAFGIEGGGYLNGAFRGTKVFAWRKDPDG